MLSVESDRARLLDLTNRAVSWVAQSADPAMRCGCADEPGILQHHLDALANDATASDRIRRKAADFSHWVHLAAAVLSEGTPKHVDDFVSWSKRLDECSSGTSHGNQLRAAKLVVAVGFIDQGAEIVIQALARPARYRSHRPVGLMLSLLRQHEVVVRLPQDTLRSIVQRAAFLPAPIRDDLIPFLQAYLKEN
jgi:hypothetical protein